MNLLECIMKNSTCYKETSRGVPVGILWHDTAAQNPNLKRYVQPCLDSSDYNSLIIKIGKNNYNNDWNSIYIEAGLNAWIGKLADGSIGTIQTLPWDYRPWGCGQGNKGSCNGLSDGRFWIQFEICDDGYQSKEYFNKVYNEACELTAYLCKKFNINPNGIVSYNNMQIPTILCHNDSYKFELGCNSNDVYLWFNKFGKTMNDVRNDVSKLINSVSSSTTRHLYRVRKSWKDIASQIGAYSNLDNAKKACNTAGNGYCVFDETGKLVYSAVSSKYAVKVIVDALNIRAGAGVDYKINGCIKDKGVYNIVEEKNGFGKLLSGAGWICLKYTKRL